MFNILTCKDSNCRGWHGGCFMFIFSTRPTACTPWSTIWIKMGISRWTSWSGEALNRSANGFPPKLLGCCMAPWWKPLNMWKWYCKLMFSMGHGCPHFDLMLMGALPVRNCIRLVDLSPLWQFCQTKLVDSQDGININGSKSLHRARGVARLKGTARSYDLQMLLRQA